MASILSSSNNSFKGQLPNEKIILITRKHWITLFGPFMFLVIFSLAPGLIYYLVNDSPWYPFLENFLWLINLIYYLILWNIFFFNLMIYSLNIIIVTDKRVIKNSQVGFFRYTSGEMEINKIQDITVKIKGFLAAIFDFGDLEIQTAGSQNKFYFSTLPHPNKIKKTIMELRS